MIRYIFKRIIYSIPVLLLVTIIVFSLIHIIPGDPVLAMLGIQATTSMIANLRAQLNLDKPIVVQYYLWLKDVFRGDLGESIRSKQPVLKLVLNSLSPTVLLALTSLLFSVFFSIIAGAIAASKRNTIFDFGAMFIAVLGISIPAFWLGIMVILILSVNLNIFPAMGYVSFLKNPIDALMHLILPAATLGFGLVGYTTRMTRSQMLEVLNQDFIRTARAKGLLEVVVIYKHALRNALIPIVTAVGIQLGFLLGGAILIEQIFAWPGIGRLAVLAINSKDYTVLQGTVLVVATMFVIINLIVDILYTFLNPKIKLK